MEHYFYFGYHMREAGATARKSWRSRSLMRSPTGCRVARGLDVDDFAGLSRSSLPPGPSCSRRVAKFRVARRMWAIIMRERFGATNPRSWVCRVHVQTAGSS